MTRFSSQGYYSQRAYQIVDMENNTCKPNTLYSEAKTRQLIEECIWQDGTGGDSLNTTILKDKLYERRLKGADKTSLTFDEAYALGAFISNYAVFDSTIFDRLGYKVKDRADLTSHLKIGGAANVTGKKILYMARVLPPAVALQTAGMTATEIAGSCAAVFDFDIPKYLNPNVEYVIDNCGMGGDRLFTSNLSTVALFAVSGYKGIKTCKHGSPGNTDSAGSSDFAVHLIKEIAKEEGLESKLLDKKNGVFDEIGFLTKVTPEKMSGIIEKTGFGYTEAVDTNYKTIHVLTQFLGHIAHINDIIGPITAPVNPQKMTKRIVGVNHLVDTKTAAEAYEILNKKGVTNVQSAYIIRGGGEFQGRGLGMDEFTNLGPTEITEIQNGVVKETYSVTPEDFGLKTYTPKGAIPYKGRLVVEGISPGYEVLAANGGKLPAGEKLSDYKKVMSTQLLKDELSGPARDLQLMNIAPMLVLCGVASSLEKATETADQLLKEKRGYEVAKDFVRCLA